MATIQGVAKEEDFCAANEEGSASCAVVCKICVAKEVAIAKGIEFKCKICGVPKEGEEASALLIRCKVCVNECIFCVAKAAAFNRFKAAGRDSIETAEKEVKARPLGKVTTTNLSKIMAEGGYITKMAAKVFGSQ